jgi:DNA-binding transcriptional LysR family regulator
MDTIGLQIKNIPTDLLRTLVTVVDLKGFTRAGERLGRSQPAISLQIKRLQELLGLPLFEAGGAQLTEHGQLVFHYARRILALNDEIVARLGTTGPVERFRVGLPEPLAGMVLPILVAEDRARGRRVVYDVTCALSDNLIADIAAGRLDIAVAALAAGGDGRDTVAAISWHEPLSWVGQRDVAADTARPLPLLVLSEQSVLRRAMVAALARIGRSYEVVLSCESLNAIRVLSEVGVGVSVLPSRLCGAAPVLTAGDGLPGLADLDVGLFLSAGDQRSEAFTLAVRLAELLNQSLTV